MPTTQNGIIQYPAAVQLMVSSIHPDSIGPVHIPMFCPKAAAAAIAAPTHQTARHL